MPVYRTSGSSRLWSTRVFCFCPSLQAVSEPKMGGRIRVVDGGLSDMYAHSVRLADGLVTMFWTLISNSSIAVAVRGEHPTGFFAIGFGR